MHYENFPLLTPDNHLPTSPSTWAYNCIAWALGENDVFYSPLPEYYWPRRLVPLNALPTTIALLFNRLRGFEDCSGDTSLEVGFEKVAIYVAQDGSFVHVALQKACGKWTSKLSEHEDIEHDTAEALLGGEYHAIAFVLRRSRS